MIEEIIPGAEITPDVPETVETVEEKIVESAEEISAETEQEEPKQINYAEMSISQLASEFENLAKSEDRLQRSKEAEAIRAAFYKRLIKDKAEAGFDVAGADVPKDYDEEEEEAPKEQPANPFEAIENSFKAFYNAYKRERAEYNKQLEKEREGNLKLKEAVIADLKELVEKQDDVNRTFPEFRKIQERWRAIGPVPVSAFRNLNDTYQLYVEKFYDMVSINRELRDLDFKKNLEAKTEFCEIAEKLAENENVVEAFRELQKLHDKWKDFGPVAKQYREEIWDRFKAATAVINKKYQAHFEGLKDQQASNLDAKTKLCEKVEEIAEREVKDSNQWNAFSKEIEEIQKEWKAIGFASKKENQKIYDRFRAACDKFFLRKREFYTEYKDNMNSNYDKKIALCEAAEALKSSTEWKKATDQFINLQKQWKEIGAVPRKKSEQLWKRFRAACDEFFEERDKQAKPENDFYNNMKAKTQVINDIKAFVLTGDEDDDIEAMNGFMQRWASIGFVPFKEKDRLASEYKDALAAKFPGLSRRRNQSRGAKAAPKSEKDRLIQKYSKKEQDIVTYENNIGFFAMSKNSAPFIKQMQERIAEAKEELKELERQIRALDEVEGEE